MTARTRRLFRVTATYKDRAPFVRHYQSKAAADRRAAQLRKGLSLEPTVHDDGVEIPPAVSVKVEASDPITWPAPVDTIEIYTVRDPFGFRWTRTNPNGLIVGSATQTYADERDARHNIATTQRRPYRLDGVLVTD